MFLHCIRSLHFLKDVSDLFFFDSVQLYILVYVRYMSWDVFPMYLHCIRSLHFFERCCFFLTQTGISCLQPLHVMGWFSYVLHCICSLHFLKDVSDLFFFDSVQLYKLSTFVTCH